jgi:hypothetical protein
MRALWPRISSTTMREALENLWLARTMFAYTIAGEPSARRAVLSAPATPVSSARRPAV